MDEEVRALVYPPAELERLANTASFLTLPFTSKSLKTFRGDLRAVDAVFSSWGMPTLDEALLARLPACKVVFHAAGTIRSFATPAMWARGIRVTSAASINAIPVAEYTLAAIIFSLKHAWKRIAELKQRQPARKCDPWMPGACGSTVGLLSLSRTGQRVAERLRTLDVQVIAHDPLVDPVVAKALNVELCSLAEVFSRAHVVSCHMPLLPETRSVLREHHFASLRIGATFVNTARGEVVHEPELFAVLCTRPDLTAVLDVVQNEPVSADSPLLTLPNIVITPHIAGSLGPECSRMGRMMLDEAHRFLRDEPLHGEVLQSQMEFTA